MSQPAVVSQHEITHGGVVSYTIGFVLSIALTLVAYYLVVDRVVSGWTTVIVILGLGVLQLFVQLLFFLHLGAEKRPRWNLMVLLFMATMLLVIVVGSLWIMNSLDYYMGHSDHEVKAYLKSQDDL